MKILENKQVRGILVGVVFGLITAFTLQAFDVALWLCLLVGILAGLDTGYFAADLRQALDVHRRVIDKMNFELHLPMIDWFALKPTWTWKQVRNFLGDALATVVGVGVLVAFCVGVAIFFLWFPRQPDWWHIVLVVWTLMAIIITVIYLLCLGLLDYGGKPARGLPFALRYFDCRTYRQRILFRLGLSPVLSSVGTAIFFSWFALSVCFLPLYALAAIFKLARQNENAAITIGIITGVIAGFTYGYMQNFALVGELSACGIGAVVGLATGALSVLCGNEKITGRCMAGYSKVAVWRHCAH